MLLCLKYSYYSALELFDHYGECPLFIEQI